MKRFTTLLWLLGLTVVLSPAASLAQGLLVVINPDEVVRLPRPIIIHPPRPTPPPLPPQSYKIKEVAIQAKLVDQVAQVQVSQSFVNTGSRQMEVCFVFPLPYDGAIDQLTLLVDGKEYAAKLLAAKEARRQYEAIVRKNQDPALLEWVGTGMFKTSVFPVPPGAERKVTLRYSQLLRKDHTLTDFLFPLSTAKYTSHAGREAGDQRRDRKRDRDEERLQPDARGRDQAAEQHSAVVEVLGEEHRADERLPAVLRRGQGQARRQRDELSAQDGRRRLLPAAGQPADQGAGRRAAQEDGGLRRRSLGQHERQEDRAGQGSRSSSCSTTCAKGTCSTSWPTTATSRASGPSCRTYDDETRKRRWASSRDCIAGGSTNIDGGLTTALAMLKDSSRPNFVIFLTDGLPTVGETNEGKIVAVGQAVTTRCAPGSSTWASATT